MEVLHTVGEAVSGTDTVGVEDSTAVDKVGGMQGVVLVECLASLQTILAFRLDWSLSDREKSKQTGRNPM